MLASLHHGVSGVDLLALQGTKIYGKLSLKCVPLIGWAWMFTESIFLRRDWDKDRQIIARDLKYIRDYPDGYWVTVRDGTSAVH